MASWRWYWAALPMDLIQEEVAIAGVLVIAIPEVVVQAATAIVHAVPLLLQQVSKIVLVVGVSHTSTIRN